MAGNHKKLAHLFDVTQCIGCSACIVACAETNYPEMMERTNEGWNWLAANIRKVTLERARHPVQLLVQCQQCDNAPCVTTCPFGANYHDRFLANSLGLLWFSLRDRFSGNPCLNEPPEL